MKHVISYPVKVFGFEAHHGTEQSLIRRVLVAVVEGGRQRDRPKLRWEDGVTGDARKLGERNWRNAARNRDSWQKLLKETLVQKGLLCQ